MLYAHARIWKEKKLTANTILKADSRGVSSFSFNLSQVAIRVERSSSFNLAVESQATLIKLMRLEVAMIRKALES